MLATIRQTATPRHWAAMGLMAVLLAATAANRDATGQPKYADHAATGRAVSGNASGARPAGSAQTRPVSTRAPLRGRANVGLTSDVGF